ncbi:MAG: hypothetical protein NTY41_08340 [Proteobacteria bacterium]|nr:hypothetical protein [Pseudomonadota bacterium]
MMIHPEGHAEVWRFTGLTPTLAATVVTEYFTGFDGHQIAFAQANIL